MGCDIHAYIEAKISNSWYFVGKAPSRRDYYLFSELSGVRAYHGQQAFFAEEFPEDASDQVSVEFILWGSDAHTPAHANINELHQFAEQRYDSLRKSVVKEYGEDKELTREEVLGDCAKWIDALNELCENEWIEDARVVIWYDN